MSISKKISVGIFFVIVAGFLAIKIPAIINSNRQFIARTLWEKTHISNIATLIDPISRDLHFDIGNYYFDSRHYDLEKAAQHFKIAIKADEQFFESHYQLGRIYFLQGKFDMALIEITDVLRINPDFRKGYYMLGLIGGYTGDDIQAIYGFSEFIRRDSFNWAGYNDLAWIYFRQGNFTKAREVVEVGLKQSPSNPWLRNLHGAVLINLKEPVLAKVSLEIADRESALIEPKDWGRAYPGNNPSIYSQGLEEMRSVIKHNLSLLDTGQLPPLPSGGIY